MVEAEQNHSKDKAEEPWSPEEKLLGAVFGSKFNRAEYSGYRRIADERDRQGVANELGIPLEQVPPVGSPGLRELKMRATEKLFEEVLNDVFPGMNQVESRIIHLRLDGRNQAEIGQMIDPPLSRHQVGRRYRSVLERGRHPQETRAHEDYLK